MNKEQLKAIEKAMSFLSTMDSCWVSGDEELKFLLLVTDRKIQELQAANASSEIINMFRFYATSYFYGKEKAKSRSSENQKTVTEKFVINVVYCLGNSCTEQLPMDCTQKLYNTKEEAMEAIRKEAFTKYPNCEQTLFPGEDRGWFKGERWGSPFLFEVYINPVTL